MGVGNRLAGRAWALLTLAVVVSGCGDDGATGAEERDPIIVATTSVWADVVTEATCGAVPVEVVVPAGADPHGFEPSLADRAQLESASLVVANGLDLEEGLTPTLTAVADTGTPVFRIGETIDPLIFGESDRPDPHVWLDPLRVAASLDSLAEAIGLDPGLDTEAVKECASSYHDELVALDAEIDGILGDVPAARRRLVTNHDTLRYFADRYDLEVLGSVIPASSTLAEPTPAALTELADAINTAGIGAVFADVDESTSVIDRVADAAGGVEVVELRLDSLGPPDSGTETYVGLLRVAAGRIAAGLGAG